MLSTYVFTKPMDNLEKREVINIDDTGIEEPLTNITIPHNIYDQRMYSQCDSSRGLETYCDSW